MRRKAMVMDKFNMYHATYLSKSRVDSIIEQAKLFTDDPEKEDRIRKSECVACFYSTGMAGQAFTYRPCMSCGKDMMFSSTNTDALCIDCAKDHKLCKHCGGDIDLKVNRRKWPEPKNNGT